MTSAQKIIRSCATGRIETLVAYQSAILCDVQKSPLSLARTKMRELVRIIDSIGSFRFGSEWDDVSPARKADRAAGLLS